MSIAKITGKLSLKTIVVWVVFLLFIFIFIYTALELQESKLLNAKTVTHFLAQFGYLAGIFYIALMILAVVTPIPDSIVTIAGGYIFGPVVGSLFSLIGLAIGTSFDFWLARRLGRDFVSKKFPHSMDIIDRYAQKSGWWTVFIMRVLPSVTFDLIGYSAGLSSMQYRIYIGSTLLGAIPMTLFTIFLGHSLHIKSLQFTVVVIILGISAVTTGSYIAHRIHISSLSDEKLKLMREFPTILSYYISHIKKLISKNK